MSIFLVNKAIREARRTCIAAAGVNFSPVEAQRQVLVESVKGIYADIVRLSDPSDIKYWQQFRGLDTNSPFDFNRSLKLFFQKCVVDVQSHTLEHDGFMSNESSLQRHPLLHFNVRTFDGDNGSGPISYLGKARMAWGYNLD
jgi:hypothetical protein